MLQRCPLANADDFIDEAGRGGHDRSGPAYDA